MAGCAAGVGALGREERPWWVTKVRRARAREDRDGVDVVVYTDVGRLFLQVKRSRVGAARWEQEHAADPRPIGIMVVKEYEDEAIVLWKAVGALILLREKILSARAQGAVP